MNSKGKVGSTTEYIKVLKEATSNENWNISNTKLQILADHSYTWNDYNVIMKHLWKKLNSKPKDWRRIYKALHAMEFLIKNGAPRVIQDIKDELFKIRSFQDFSYNENGTDRGQGVRDKSRAICELLSDHTRLQEEREFAKTTRDKFHGISNKQVESGMPIPAAPASGKYGGFGSEDFEKHGYKAGQFNQPYDPFMASQSISTQQDSKSKEGGSKADEPAKKKKKKKKQREPSSDEEDSDDSEESSDSESEKQKKKKSKKAKKPSGLGKPEKAVRSLDAQASAQPSAAPSQPDLMSIIDTNPAPSAPQPSSFGFIGGTQQQAAPQAQPDIFGGMNIMPVQQQQQPPQTTPSTAGLFDIPVMNQPPPAQTQSAFGLPMGTQQQPPQQQFNIPQQQQQQPFVQQQQQPFQGFQQPMAQTQPSHAQNTNMFGNLNVKQDSQTTPQQQQQQQQQPTSWQPKTTSQNDTWNNSGLFDLNNLASGQKKLEVHNEASRSNQNNQTSNLLTANEDLDQLWSGSPNPKPTGQSTGFVPNLGGFQQQQNQNVSQFGQRPSFGAPSGGPGMYGQQQPQPTMFNPGMNMGQPGGNFGMGFQQQQQQPGMGFQQQPGMGYGNGNTMGQNNLGYPNQQQQQPGYNQFPQTQFMNQQQQPPFNQQYQSSNQFQGSSQGNFGFM